MPDTVVAVATSSPCSSSPDTCGCGTGGRVVGFEPPSNFPKLWSTLATGARLRVPAITDGAGFCRPVPTYYDYVSQGGAESGHPYDVAFGEYCEPALTSEGLRCAPDFDTRASIVRDVFSDSGCTQPLPLVGYCYGFSESGTCVVAYDFGGVGTDAYYTLEPQGIGAFYEGAPGSCQPSIYSSHEWWPLGGRAEALFEPLTLVID